jgi:predicted Zn finger-like uncharacterized protein
VSLLDRAFDRCSAGRDSHGRILYPASDLRLGYRGHHGAGGFDLLLPAARFAISRHHAPQVVVSAVYPGASAQVDVGPVLEGRTFFCPHCGALYSVTHSQLSKSESNTAKCVVCLKVMDRWDAAEARTFKLIHRPEDA